MPVLKPFVFSGKLIPCIVHSKKIMFFNFVVPGREEALSLRIKQGPERPVEEFYFLSIGFFSGT